jgi:hypothetical protein
LLFGPSTVPRSILIAVFPSLLADSLFQVFHESKTLGLGPLCHRLAIPLASKALFLVPLCHASVCVRKTHTHFTNIRREFFSERATASVQRLDLPNQSSHIFGQHTHVSSPLRFFDLVVLVASHSVNCPPLRAAAAKGTGQSRLPRAPDRQAATRPRQTRPAGRQQDPPAIPATAYGRFA